MPTCTECNAPLDGSNWTESSRRRRKHTCTRCRDQQHRTNRANLQHVAGRPTPWRRKDGQPGEPGPSVAEIIDLLARDQWSWEHAKPAQRVIYLGILEDAAALLGVPFSLTNTPDINE